jgi:acyl-CoA synthetase (AMP-forming)/AMP-acid ligase II
VPVDAQERVVVVAERSGAARDRWQPEQITRAVRQSVWQRHDLALHDVVLTTASGIPRTTSGKVSRTACRERYLAGYFDEPSPVPVGVADV